MDPCRLAARLALVVACFGCGKAPPSPTNARPDHPRFLNVVSCSNCPGLTNVTYDRNGNPHWAQLPVGAQTSVILTECLVDDPGSSQGPEARVSRWVTDPTVLSIVPSGTGSATVKALRPGFTLLEAEIDLADGTTGRARLIDALAGIPAACSLYPGLIFRAVE